MSAPVALPPGWVLVAVPPSLAGGVRRIVLQDLIARLLADDCQPTAGARHLLFELARVEHRYDVDQAAAAEASSAIGTSDTVSPIVEISTSEAAALLGCTTGYVRRLCRSGVIGCRRAGRRAWLIDRASFDAYRHGGHK